MERVTTRTLQFTSPVEPTCNASMPIRCRTATLLPWVYTSNGIDLRYDHALSCSWFCIFPSCHVVDLFSDILKLVDNCHFIQLYQANYGIVPQLRHGLGYVAIRRALTSSRCCCCPTSWESSAPNALEMEVTMLPQTPVSKQKRGYNLRC